MKKYTLPSARLFEPNAHAHPERTAYKRRSSDPMDFDMICQVWPNRASMARTIRMQEQRESCRGDWQPIQKLTTTEGY